MDKQITLRNFIISEKERYSNLYLSMTKQQSKFPKGSIVRRSDGNFSVAIRENGQQYQITLRPEDNVLFKQLKDKRYIKEALPILENKINACKEFLEIDSIYDPLQIERTLPTQYASPNVHGIFLPDDIYPIEWNNGTCINNGLYTKDLKHITSHGVKVRSKSEALIGTQLEHHNLNFQYEPEVKCGRQLYYPDFAILQPVLRRIVYWEHLGLIENPEYVLHNLKKLNDYSSHGIYLGINLVLTYETKEQPLTIDIIEDKIDEILNLHRMKF